MRFVFKPDVIYIRNEESLAMIDIRDDRHDPPRYLHLQYDKMDGGHWVELNSQRYGIDDGIGRVFLGPNQLILTIAPDSVGRMNGISTVEARLDLLQDRLDELRQFFCDVFGERVIVDT